MLGDIFSLSKFSQPEQISSNIDFTTGPWMLNQPIILRQPFQQKNLCWDDCTFGRVHEHSGIYISYENSKDLLISFSLIWLLWEICKYIGSGTLSIVILHISKQHFVACQRILAISLRIVFQFFSINFKEKNAHQTLIWKHTKYWGSSGVINFTRRGSKWD